MAQAPADAPQSQNGQASGAGNGAGDHAHEHRHGGFWALMLGSIGVVYGDIGTSPLYALRECLRIVTGGAGPPTHDEVIGVVSMIFWALIIVVTIKSVLVLLRFDNRGEGGTLSLMALVRRMFEKRNVVLLALGMLGASLFYADAMITPAISVISSVEGLRAVPGIGNAISPWVLLISVVILVLLFMAQSRGTARIGALFGPITLVWFLTMAALGVYHIAGDVSILAALSPLPAMGFMISHGGLAFVVLGAVFLAVTGAEQFKAYLQNIVRTMGRGAQIRLFIPTMYDPRRRISKQVVSLLRDLGSRVTEPIWVDTLLSEAPGHGQTIFEYAPRSRGARDYYRLAKTVENMPPIQTNSSKPNPAKGAGKRG